jgi:hypothetical protein
MSRTTPALQAEQKGIGNAFVYTELIVHFSPDVVGFLNGKAATADGLLDGDWVDFQPGDYQVIALPLRPLSFDEGRQRYRALRVKIDDQDLRLADFPRFFSWDAANPELFRNGPTWIPVERFPADFFGQEHEVSLFEGDEKIFGPVNRFFASRTSGITYHAFNDGEGHLTAEISHLDPINLTGHGLNPLPLVTIWTDPVFGEPIVARQVDADGTVHRLAYKLLGRDFVGDTCLFLEGVLTDLKPTDQPVRIEVDFPNRGTGLANVMWGGYTGPGAHRADATVR